MVFIPFLFSVFSSTSAKAASAGLQFKMWHTTGTPTMPRTAEPNCTGVTETLDIYFQVTPLCNRTNLMTVEFTGHITPDVDVQYLYLQSDDGNQLYMNDVLVSNAWYPSGNAGSPIAYSMQAGQSYPIKVNFFESGGGSWIRLNYYNPNIGYVVVPSSWFTQSEPTPTTTTLSPYLNQVTNLTAVANENGSVNLDWDAPTSSNVDIYAYGVTFYDLDEIGGTTSGGWGVWTNQGTNYSLGEWMFSGSNPVTTGFGPVRFGIKAGNQSCFSNEGVGACVYGPETTVDVTVLDPTPSTTSTTSTSIVPTTTTSTTIVSPINNTTTTEPAVVTLPTENTTVSIPETETPISPTTTTLIETIFNPPTEVIPIETPTSEGNTEGDGPVTSVPQYAPEQETTTQTDEPPIVVPEAVQDAADTAVADIFDGPMSDAGLANAVDDLVADAGTPEELTAVVSSLLDQELSDTQFATVIESVFDGPMSNENFAAAVDAVFEDPTKLSDAQFEDAVVAVFDGPLSDAQFEDAVAAVFEDTKTLSDEQFDAAVQEVFDEPLTTEQFSDALEAVFDEPISDEKFDAIIGAVLDEPISDEQFEELVGVLESDTVTEEQVAAAVDSVIENGVTEDQATDLATSEKVLQSIDGEQATEIFDAVEITNVTPEEAAQLVEAVQDAPTEVRESMESEINVFSGPIDTYVPLGSSIPVSGRRVIIGVGVAVLFSAPPTIRRK